MGASLCQNTCMLYVLWELHSVGSCSWQCPVFFSSLPFLWVSLLTICLAYRQTPLVRQKLIRASAIIRRNCLRRGGMGCGSFPLNACIISKRAMPIANALAQ